MYRNSDRIKILVYHFSALSGNLLLLVRYPLTLHTGVGYVPIGVARSKKLGTRETEIMKRREQKR